MADSFYFKQGDIIYKQSVIIIKSKEFLKTSVDF